MKARKLATYGLVNCRKISISLFDPNSGEEKTHACAIACSIKGVFVRKLVQRLLVALSLWVVLIAGCFLYSFLHPSNLAFAGLDFLTLWYFYIPFLLTLVCLVWIAVQRIVKARTGQ
jgi:hypothetical protein